MTRFGLEYAFQYRPSESEVHCLVVYVCERMLDLRCQPLLWVPFPDRVSPKRTLIDVFPMTDGVPCSCILLG